LGSVLPSILSSIYVVTGVFDGEPRCGIGVISSGVQLLLSAIDLVDLCVDMLNNVVVFLRCSCSTDKGVLGLALMWNARYSLVTIGV
jgi:hypothetical protein